MRRLCTFYYLAARNEQVGGVNLSGKRGNTSHTPVVRYYNDSLEESRRDITLQDKDTRKKFATMSNCEIPGAEITGIGISRSRRGVDGQLGTPCSPLGPPKRAAVPGMANGNGSKAQTRVTNEHLEDIIASLTQELKKRQMYDKTKNENRVRNGLLESEPQPRARAENTCIVHTISGSAPVSQHAHAASPAFSLSSDSSLPSPPPPPSPPLPLTNRQLFRLFLRASLPFFGFGLCDNLIMITVGDVIDATFGVTLGFSTMVAAGFGQAVSDGAGISIQGAIENASDKLGLPSPEITAEQSELASTRWWTQLFRTVGIVSGCLVGVLFALVYDSGNRPRLLDTVFQTLSEETRKELMSRKTIRIFKEGDLIMTYGEEAPGLFIIVTGLANIVGRDITGAPMHIHLNSPGDSVGAVELTFGHKCVADVVVASPTLSAVFISKEDFESVIDPENHPDRFEKMRDDARRFLRADDDFVAYRIRYLSRAQPTQPDANLSSTACEEHQKTKEKDLQGP